MNVASAALAVLLAALSACAAAEGFGIRFVVDDTTLLSQESRELMVLNLNQKIKELNAIYRDSQVDLTANIVDLQFSTMQDRDLTVILREMQVKKGAFTDFVAKANQYGADFTVAIVPHLQTQSYWQLGKRNICGAAHGNWNLPDLKSVETSYAVINPSCGTSSLAHELGHLMGVNHGIAMARCFPDKKEGVPITPYAYGYSEGECNGKPSPEKFGDIMTGGLMQFVDGSLKWVTVFSNPRIRRPECGARGICGDPEVGDAARALNENAKYFIKHHSRPQ